MFIRQPQQPVGHLSVLDIELALVEATGLADAKRLAGHTNAYARSVTAFWGHLSPARWPHHFHSSASATISALSFSLGYIFFRRRISSSSSFIWAIIDRSMPRYLVCRFYNIAVLIPHSRQISGTANPASTRLTASIISLSVHFDFLM